MSTRTIVMAGGLLLALVLVGVAIVPELVNDDEGSSQRPSSSPGSINGTADAASTSSDPIEFGSAVFTAWSNREQSYEAWWGGLRPYLDEAAIAAYQATDPAEIPNVTIKGDLTVDAEAPDLPGLSAMVRVPTSGGEFGLFLVRVEEGSPWRLLRINFPEGGSKA